MGMFDYIRCKAPLPLPQFQDNEFQTKDTPAQWCDTYEIREDGLYHQDYDTEDRSELGLWKKENPGLEPPEEMKNNPLKSLCGCITSINHRWVKCEDFTDTISFYNCMGKDNSGWIEFSASFRKGQLLFIDLVEHREPKP